MAFTRSAMAIAAVTASVIRPSAQIEVVARV